MNALPRYGYLALNLAAYQVGWLACVWSATAGRPTWGVFVAAALMGLHLVQSDAPRRDARLAATLVAVGLVVDSVQAALGVFRFTEPTTPAWITPPWLLAIWGLFAITLHASLGWLAGRYWLSVVLGAVAGPAAYWAGARLGALEFRIELPAALAVLALVWGTVLPAVVWLAHRGPARPAARSIGDPPYVRVPPRSLQGLRVVAIGGFSALLLAIWLGGLWDPDFAGFSPILESMWGWVTLLDLYLGFALVAAWMVATSKDWRIGLLWAAAVFVLGNLVTAAFLIDRARQADSWQSLLIGHAR